MTESSRRRRSVPAPEPRTPVASLGVNGASAVLPNGVGDPHYTLTSVPGSTSDIRVLTSAGGYPANYYSGDAPLSAWIGPDSDQLVRPVGSYTYKTTFTLAGLNPTTALITGQWATDNEGLGIYLNGNFGFFAVSRG